MPETHKIEIPMPLYQAMCEVIEKSAEVARDCGDANLVHFLRESLVKFNREWVNGPK
jgi:hypothetical protein